MEHVWRASASASWYTCVCVYIIKLLGACSPEPKSPSPLYFIVSQVSENQPGDDSSLSSLAHSPPITWYPSLCRLQPHGTDSVVYLLNSIFSDYIINGRIFLCVCATSIVGGSKSTYFLVRDRWNAPSEPTTTIATNFAFWAREEIERQRASTLMARGEISHAGAPKRNLMLISVINVAHRVRFQIWPPPLYF